MFWSYYSRGGELVSTWGSASLRILAMGTATAVAALAAIGSASAASSGVIATQYLNATGTVTLPTYRTFTGSSSGSGPAHVVVTLTQTGAYSFSIKSVFSDDTVGATLSSNDASTTNINSYEGTINWGSEDGDVYTGTYDYVTPGTYQVTDTVTDSNGATATATVQVSTEGSAYSLVSPTRLLDTRNGTGVPAGEVKSGSIVKLKVEGAGPVPSSGVTAVVLNVTAVATTTSGYVTVYPSDDGTTAPRVSSLNYAPGQTVANFVTVPVGKDGYVYFLNEGSPVRLVADVSGYYSLKGTQGFEPEPSPIRLVDTRKGTGAPEAPVQSMGTLKVLTALNDTFLPAPGTMSAVDVNITVVNPTTAGYITAYADGTTRPGTSTVNFVKGQTVANNAIVPVGPDGSIDLTNVMGTAGSVNVVIDVEGYFEAVGQWAYAYVPINPSRDFDSRRDGLGQVEPGIDYELDLGQWAQDAGNAFIQFNVTVTNTNSNGYLTLYEEGGQLPGSSNVNWSASHQTVANAAFDAPAGSGWISMYNGGGGGTDVVLDVFGYFQSSFA